VVSEATPTRPARRIASLDGLRAISISMVVVGHASGPPEYPFGRFVAAWMHGIGELGVRVFFVISGYLITSILVHELDKRQTISLPKFYFRRTLRLFPAFYVYVATIMILEFLGKLRLQPGDVLHAVTYTMNYHRARAWWLGHCWSLSVEEQFYFLWPALLILLGRRRGLYLAGAFVVAGTAIRLGSWFAFPAAREGIGETFPTIADSIAAGCVLGGTRQWLETRSWWRAWQRSPLALLVPLAIVAAYSTWPWQRINFVLAPTTLNVAIALAVAWCIDNPDGLVGRVLNSRPFVVVGVGSYSIYLWQQLFMKDDGTLMRRFPYNLPIVAAVAALSYFLVEKPFLRLRERLEPRVFKAE
jgi:peptidoglycan/LPS O-acetylase OafA/YrhL